MGMAAESAVTVNDDAKLGAPLATLSEPISPSSFAQSQYITMLYHWLQQRPD